MYYQVLADRVRYFKEDEKGVTFMSKILEDMRNEARAEGRAEGSKENAISVARKMLRTEKFSYEEISEFTSLTLDEIKALATKQPA
jgi:predicted transposase YdaD